MSLCSLTIAVETPIEKAAISAKAVLVIFSHFTFFICFPQK
jgi:hypothetical protein